MRSDSSLKDDPDFMVLNKTLREVVIWSRFALRCSAKVAISLNSSVDGNSVEAVYATKSVSHLTPRSSPPVIGKVIYRRHSESYWRRRQVFRPVF